MAPQSPHSSAPKTHLAISAACPVPLWPGASSPPADAVSHVDLDTRASDYHGVSAAWELGAREHLDAASCATRRARGEILGRVLELARLRREQRERAARPMMVVLLWVRLVWVRIWGFVWEEIGWD